MKRHIYTALLIIFITVAFIIVKALLKYSDSEDSKYNGYAPTAAETFKPTYNSSSSEIVHDNNAYKATWVVIDSFDKLHLYPNLTEKRISKDIASERKCELLVSGGFYTQDHTPTGMFVTEEIIIKSPMKNRLFNGYVFSNKQRQVFISDKITTDNIFWALQSGPILYFDGQPLELNKTEGYDRRNIAIITSTDNLIFMTIYDPRSVFAGPILSDVPKILELFQETSGHEITGALNLDGGAASAFLAKDVTLQELTVMGSYFCIH